MLMYKLTPYLALLAILGASPALSEQQANLSPKATEILKTSTTWTSQKIKYPQTDKPMITSLVVEFPPGAKTSWHLHPMPEYIYVMEGTLMIEDENGNKRAFKPGEAFIEVDNYHQGSNPGRTPTKIMAIFFGEEGQPIRIDRATQ